MFLLFNTLRSHLDACLNQMRQANKMFADDQDWQNVLEDAAEFLSNQTINDEIQACLVVSTQHVPPTEIANDSLNAGPNVRIAPHQHGWIVFFATDYDIAKTPVEPWFEPILKHALKNGYSMINFDQDADVNDSFQQYDW